MKGIKYTAALLDASGFASASREYVIALHDHGVPVIANICSFENNRILDYGRSGEIIVECQDTKTDYDVHIIHLTPENFPRYIERGKYNIGYTTWESSHQPAQRTMWCNLLQELWVPSEYCKEVMQASDVTIPIKVVPHVAPPSLFESSVDDVNLSISGDSFKFYSIFQWSSRKNPEALLVSYLTEFSEKDNVVLILKTYLQGGGDGDFTLIRDGIQEVKKDLGLSGYPKILLITDMLSAEEIHSLHYMSDCFVMLHKSEGWDLPLMESMAAGNPTIGTGYSGNLQFMNPENSYLVDYLPTPVRGMSGNPYWAEIYKGDQVWAEPGIMSARNHMRYVFEHQEEAFAMGQKARSDIQNNFSPSQIATHIIQLLTESGHSLSERKQS